MVARRIEGVEPAARASHDEVSAIGGDLHSRVFPGQLVAFRHDMPLTATWRVRGGVRVIAFPSNDVTPPLPSRSAPAPKKCFARLTPSRGTRIRAFAAFQHDTIAPHNSHHIAARGGDQGERCGVSRQPQHPRAMADMVQEIVVAYVSPVQFMIDYLAVGSSLCQQDKYGLSMMRRARLMKIFKQDKNQDKTVDLKELRAFCRKHGETQSRRTSSRTYSWTWTRAETARLTRTSSSNSSTSSGWTTTS